jgi:putative FmdB family regulatory protein
MPLYEYDCAACGGFEGWRAMAESTSPAPCPRCGELGRRVLSVTAGRAQGARRRAIPEPTLQVRREEPPAPSAPPRPPPPPARPWMLGH